MSVKCTYESCFKRFSSEEAMIKHKIKAPEHDYCAKCKVDCQDDLDYLIHQIQSPKHSQFHQHIPRLTNPEQFVVQSVALR